MAIGPVKQPEKIMAEFSLLDLAKAIETEEAKNRNHSILLYGDSKSGKTQLAGTLAKIPEISIINWFDGENGSDTLVKMLRDGLLTSAQAAKFRIFKIIDLPDKPYFMETMLKVFTVRGPQNICITHGRKDCPLCLKNPQARWHTIDIYNQDHSVWNVLDSGSALSSSVMAWLMSGMGYDRGIKPGWDEYGPQGRMLTDMLTVVQSCVANWLVLSHVLMLDEKDVEKKMLDDKTADVQFSKIYPLIGTKNFSINCSKFFGTVIYLEKIMNKHRGGSSSTYKSSVLTGSRVGMKIEDEQELDLSKVFPKMGIYPSSAQVAPNTEKT